jgi:Kef-type K+ transport system membrane component KefB
MNQTITALGLVLIAGIFAARLINKVNLPAVTGYLLLGLLAGGSFLNVLSGPVLEKLAFIDTVALSFIAFSIGKEFRWDAIKSLGGSIILITTVQGLAASLFTLFAVWGVSGNLPLGMILGAIATATAPAATIAVIREYKADGPMTRTLLAVVALDDALGLIVFSILIPIARSLRFHEAISTFTMIVEPVKEISFALGLGTILGLALTFFLSRWRDSDSQLALTFGAVLFAGGLSQVTGLSPLLTNMALGTALANSYRGAGRLMDTVESTASAAMFIPFFIIAGATLDVTWLAKVGLVGIAYILARSLGKILGAGIGAQWAHAQKSVIQNLGIALLPQAGVAVGMVAMIRTEFPILAPEVSNVVLASVIIYELIGPVAARIALKRSGEIGARSGEELDAD